LAGDTGGIGVGTAWSFAFDLPDVSNEAGRGVVLVTLADTGAVGVSVAISATAGGKITAFFRGSGRGCAQQLEFNARSNNLKLLISTESLVVLNHQMAPPGVSAKLKPQRQRRKVQPSIAIR